MDIVMGVSSEGVDVDDRLSSRGRNAERLCPCRLLPSTPRSALQPAVVTQPHNATRRRVVRTAYGRSVRITDVLFRAPGPVTRPRLTAVSECLGEAPPHAVAATRFLRVSTEHSAPPNHQAQRAPPAHDSP